jgi:cyclohexa-1,5-dienecarbonyl-CoA hydratase
MTESWVRHDVSTDGAVHTITLDKPPGNVVDIALCGQLRPAIALAADATDAKVLVVRGAGKHFSFGASVEEHRAEVVAGMLSQFHGLFRLLMEVSIPTFAVVRGQCLGGGLELVSYCTRVFASDSAHFGQPEIKLAVFPPMASVLLPWRCGAHVGLDLCVSGRSVDAAHAHAVGLVQELSADPMQSFEAYFGEHIVSLSATSLRLAERAVRTSLRAALEQYLPSVERLYLDELMQTPDANEGIAAFLDKRPPNYGDQR